MAWPGHPRCGVSSHVPSRGRGGQAERGGRGARAFVPPSLSLSLPPIRAAAPPLTPTSSLPLPPSSPSEGGFFNALLTFPPDYPQSPPSCRFTSDMWHPNVYDDGRVCISILHSAGDDPMGYETAAERWSPVHTVRLGRERERGGGGTRDRGRGPAPGPPRPRLGGTPPSPFPRHQKRRPVFSFFLFFFSFTRSPAHRPTSPSLPRVLRWKPS